MNMKYLALSLSRPVTQIDNSIVLTHLHRRLMADYLNLVIGMGCVILLWHSLGLPYNYFALNVQEYYH